MRTKRRGKAWGNPTKSRSGTEALPQRMHEEDQLATEQYRKELKANGHRKDFVMRQAKVYAAALHAKRYSDDIDGVDIIAACRAIFGDRAPSAKTVYRAIRELAASLPGTRSSS